jgi:hypothetical protein
MAEDETLVASIATTLDTRKQKLAQMLDVKLEQGYRVESRGDTEAVLYTQGRRSLFGLFGTGEGARQMISVDEQGAGTTRKLSGEGS